jgi:hypothetical protein
MINPVDMPCHTKGVHVTMNAVAWLMTLSDPSKGKSRPRPSPSATHATWYSLDLSGYGAIIGNDWVSVEAARWRRRAALSLRVKDPSRSRLHDIILH